MGSIFGTFREMANAFADINEKYRRPRFKVTRMVSFWLFMLQLYLAGTLLLLAYKFITVVMAK